MAELAAELLRPYINSYSGFDRRASRDWTGTVIDRARRHLPEPVMPRVCRTKGHKWVEIPSVFPGEVKLEGCARCARAGMVVLQTSYPVAERIAKEETQP